MGSPSPTGTPVATTSTTPPEESPVLYIRLQAATISSAASMSGQFITSCTPYFSRTSSLVILGAFRRICGISFSISAKT